MISDNEKKVAFRIAYDAVTAHGDPEFTKEYFSGVCIEFDKLIQENKENRLLPRLLSGVYDFLTDEAKRRQGG